MSTKNLIFIHENIKGDTITEESFGVPYHVWPWGKALKRTGTNVDL